MQRKKLLIISSVWVEPKSSAAGCRMCQLIHFFQSGGYEIFYASTAAVSEFSLDLNEIGVTQVNVALNDSSFDDFITSLDPSLVLFDRFMVEEQFGWRVANKCPKAVRILDSEDLHCLRDARRTAYKNRVEFSNKMLISEVAKREIASIFRCDLTLMISEFEMDLLQSFFKVEKKILFYLPLLVDNLNADLKAPQLTFDERKDVVFIGNFLHEPNWNCVQVLKNEIWPILSRQLPEANLLIYGAYPSQKVYQLHNPKERFFIKGRAEHVEDVIGTARILLAPIRFGAGIKGKLLDAMRLGTPSVTTSIGAEAMNGFLSWNGCIADDNESFITGATALYSDKNIWENAQKNGYEIIKERFHKELFFSDLTSKIDGIIHDLEEHRLLNFIGCMLQHHTLQSTHYMSKWIEEKNKK